MTTSSAISEADLWDALVALSGRLRALETKVATLDAVLSTHVFMTHRPEDTPKPKKGGVRRGRKAPKPQKKRG